MSLFDAYGLAVDNANKPFDVFGSATFEGETHRTQLDRWWREGDRALVVMANPSKAGENGVEDPTTRRLNALLRHLWAGYTVRNWETRISSSPAEMLILRVRDALYDPLHADRVRANLSAIRRIAVHAPIRIIAWGNLVPAEDPHTAAVLDAMSLGGAVDLFCFGTTEGGAPKHPMARGRHRIPDDFRPIVWRPARSR